MHLRLEGLGLGELAGRDERVQLDARGPVERGRVGAEGLAVEAVALLEVALDRGERLLAPGGELRARDLRRRLDGGIGELRARVGGGCGRGVGQWRAIRA